MRALQYVRQPPVLSVVDRAAGTAAATSGRGTLPELGSSREPRTSWSVLGGSGAGEGSRAHKVRRETGARRAIGRPTDSSRVSRRTPASTPARTLSWHS